MTRYTYKGYVLINADGYCCVYRNGQFIAAWPQVNWCKMMIDAAIRNGQSLTEYLEMGREEARRRVIDFAAACRRAQ